MQRHRRSRRILQFTDARFQDRDILLEKLRGREALDVAGIFAVLFPAFAHARAADGLHPVASLLEVCILGQPSMNITRTILRRLHGRQAVPLRCETCCVEIQITDEPLLK